MPGPLQKFPNDLLAIYFFSCPVGHNPKVQRPEFVALAFSHSTLLLLLLLFLYLVACTTSWRELLFVSLIHVTRPSLERFMRDEDGRVPFIDPRLSPEECTNRYPLPLFIYSSCIRSTAYPFAVSRRNRLNSISNKVTSSATSPTHLTPLSVSVVATPELQLFVLASKYLQVYDTSQYWMSPDDGKDRGKGIEIDVINCLFLMATPLFAVCTL